MPTKVLEGHFEKMLNDDDHIDNVVRRFLEKEKAVILGAPVVLYSAQQKCTIMIAYKHRDCL